MGVYRRGKRYWIEFEYRGKRYREAAGPTYAIARRYLVRRRANVEAGRLLGATRPVTLEKWSETYLKWAREHKKSYGRDESSLKHLLEHVGALTLDQFTPDVIEGYQTTRRSEKTRFKRVPTPATINREVACLKKMILTRFSGHRDYAANAA